MGIEKKTITECIDRLVRLPASNQVEFGTKAKDIRDDLARAFQKHGRNDDHVRRVTDEIIDALKFRPTPADIREYCDGVSANIEAEKKLPPCLVCDGAGLRTVFFLVTYRGNSFQVKRSERLLLNQEELLALRATLNPEPKPPFDAQEILGGAEKCPTCNGTGKRRAAA